MPRPCDGLPPSATTPLRRPTSWSAPQASLGPPSPRLRCEARDAMSGSVPDVHLVEARRGGDRGGQIRVVRIARHAPLPQLLLEKLVAILAREGDERLDVAVID